MISYAPLWRTLKEKNISQYKLIKDYGVDNAQLTTLKTMRLLKPSLLIGFVRFLIAESRI